ncbi:unnamed protein product [marine sediment metagenome]|uniref:Uncharacterized protein n=1 Tax=marine sediment metagenome TaxID=412755 RepID=X1QQ62_9ZZZZ
MRKIPFRGQEVDATEVDFQTRKEDWNEYQLMDGTVIKMKLVAGEVFRIEGEYDEEDNPVYIVRSKNVLIVRSPDALKRKL